MGRVSLLGAIILLPSCAVASTSVLLHIFPRSMMVGLAILAGSTICHATYTYISTCVILQYVNVIGHALANVAKRVLVIVLLYLLGKEHFLSRPLLWSVLLAYSCISGALRLLVTRICVEDRQKPPRLCASLAFWLWYW